MWVLFFLRFVVRLFDTRCAIHSRRHGARPLSKSLVHITKQCLLAIPALIAINQAFVDVTVFFSARNTMPSMHPVKLPRLLLRYSSSNDLVNIYPGMEIFSRNSPQASFLDSNFRPGVPMVDERPSAPSRTVNSLSLTK